VTRGMNNFQTKIKKNQKIEEMTYGTYLTELPPY